MSAKERFIKKLQNQQPRSGSFENKSHADIAEIRQRMSQLQGDMEDWLTGTGIQAESTTASLVELLAGGIAFTVPGITLRYENRRVKFTPVFLYGQGVTGCVEASLNADGRVTPLCRLFMRSSEGVNWTWRPSGLAVGSGGAFGEDVFFDVIGGLLS